MPIIKSAKKKLRQDLKKSVRNAFVRQNLKKSLRLFKKNPKEKDFNKIQKLIDKAAKKNIIHKNKAARLKSRLTKLLLKKGGIDKEKK